MISFFVLSLYKNIINTADDSATNHTSIAYKGMKENIEKIMKEAITQD